MPRHKRIRKISRPPRFRGFTPIGLPGTENAVVFDYEEYEAIRLCDFEGYNHLEASRLMNVSRPTFARIYENARRKVAYAFVVGLPIVFEGGKVYYDSDWYLCKSCGCKFSQSDKSVPETKCGLCGSENINVMADPEEPGNQEEAGFICYCPSCGHERASRYGEPFNLLICDKCHTRMRKRGHHEKFN